MKEVRKLKVYRRTNESGNQIPTLVLQGKWLINHGFNPGDYIAVECEENDLRIVKESQYLQQVECGLQSICLVKSDVRRNRLVENFSSLLVKKKRWPSYQR